MVGKKVRKSRTSLGREGSPHKVGKKQGLERLLNQLEAFQKGKRTRVTIKGIESNRAFHKVDGAVVFATKKATNESNSKKW